MLLIVSVKIVARSGKMDREDHNTRNVAARGRAMSLRSRMGILFLAFLLVVTVSVAATSWMVGDQNSDALVINLAGRQRMLTHQITRDALQIENGEDAESHRQDLREAAQAFDQTLRALIAGGANAVAAGAGGPRARDPAGDDLARATRSAGKTARGENLTFLSKK
jgi:hypothetical protein